MRTLRTTLIAATCLGGLFLPSIANALPITENLSFNLTGFVDVLGTSTPPDQLITGSFTVTYDPTLSYDNDTADIVVHSLTGVTVGSALGFTYQNGLLEFGGIQNDSNFVVFGTNDLVVSFNVSNPAAPTFLPCSTPGFTCGKYTGSSLVDAAGYTVSGSNTAWFYGAQSTVSPTVTPEPSSLMLFGTAMIALTCLAGGKTFRRALH